MTDQIGISNKSWAEFYRWSAWFSAAMILFIPVQIIIFVLFSPPNTVEGYFKLFQSNWLLGLLSLDFIYVLNNVILIFIYLSLTLSLFKKSPILSLTALVLGLVGIAAYFSSNPAFEMLNLSNGYWSALAGTKPQYLAAGLALLANYKGTAFNVYYVLNSIALLIYSKEILLHPRFNKALGIWGTISGALMVIPSTAGIIGMCFSFLSLIPWVVFLVLLTRCFLKLSKTTMVSDFIHEQ